MGRLSSRPMANRRLKKYTLTPESINDEKIEQIEDWIVSGVNDALRQATKAIEEKTRPFLEKLGPGMLDR